MLYKQHQVRVKKLNIHERYNAAGGKIRKTVVENGVTVAVGNTPYSDVNITTTTFYAGGQVYESKVYTNNTTVDNALRYVWQLQHVAHEEGRMRAVRPTPQSKAAITLPYDYMLKDHLGNVRMPVQPKAGVLTDEQTVDDYPTVTMEDANGASESLYYTGVNSLTRANRHASMPADASTTPNSRAALLSNAGQRIGPGILLKVQAGDEVELWCRSWWTGSMGGQTNSNQNGVRDAVASLLGQLIPGTSGGKISGAQAGANGSFFAPAILSFLQGNNPEQAGKPKAFINWLFLDEQFNYQQGNGSGAEPVRAENVYNPLHERSKNLSNPLRVGKTGYLYIYTSMKWSAAEFAQAIKK